ncbi:hypothetical protein MNAN1_003528 [Malassezia nana]|uniref:ARID domain-containing protein n=1 Tax=Malassezia nana TaxID=180528 RepID=A0AAF0ETD7_9BASI|nr:hypothetical protein MNAN1_003528 [Malassezia nana]
MSYPNPGAFPAAAQQQLAELAQQQQQIQAQQAFQIQQPGLTTLAKPQQDFLNGLTSQQVQSLLGQASANLSQPTVNVPNQFTSPSQIPQLNATPAMPTMQPMLNQNMNTILSDMINKAKAGLLTPLQLTQLRAILDQQKQTSSQPIQAQQALTSNATLPTTGTPQNVFSAMQQTNSAMQMNQPMVMPPNPTASTSHNPLGAAMDSSTMNQNNVAQGVQFIRKIQLRISEIEQKLTTPMSDTDRQSLQRAHQELTRLQATLMQKISQGIQTPASQTPNMLPSMCGQSLQNFSPSKFANAVPTKLGPNMPTNQPGSIPPGQRSMPILSVQQGQVPNVSITPEQFKRTLSELMRRHGKSLPAPIVDGREVDLYYLFTTVQSLGGSKSVTQKNMWSSVSISLGFISVSPTQQASIVLQIAQVFKTYLELFEDVWNRAMLHQLSMGRNNSQMVNASNRTESTAMKPMTQSQAPQPRPPNYGVMQTQQATQPQSQQSVGRINLLL